jgi:hypothetical protein
MSRRGRHWAQDGETEFPIGAMKPTTVGDVMTTRVVAVKKDASFAVRDHLSYAGRSDDS